MAIILIVDDSDVDSRLVKGMLKGEGYSLHFASDGTEALELMRHTVPDLVVTDLFMPHMNGLELVSAVTSQYPLVPVILMTSLGNEETAVEALQHGASSYVPKRLLGRYLTQTIRSLLAQAKERRSRARLLGSMTANECMFSLENDSEMIPSLVGYFQESMSHMGIGDETERLRASVALEEALVNAVHHGNLEVSSELRESDDNAYYRLIHRRRREPPYCDRRVEVRVRMSDTEAAFIIRDQGPGFHVDALPDPTDPGNLEKLGGRGVMLMKTFMDDVRFNAEGNEVTLIKRAVRRPADEIFRWELDRETLIVELRRNVTSMSDDAMQKELDHVLEQVRAPDVRHVVVDLEHVTRFGSSFLNALRRLWNAVKPRGGEMALCNISELGREIFEVARFDTVWIIFSSRAEAVQALRSRSAVTQDEPA